MTTEEAKITIRKAFFTKLAELLALNGNTKFAEAEQKAMVQHLVETWHESEELANEGYEIIASAVNAVGNASAYAQLIAVEREVWNALPKTAGLGLPSQATRIVRAKKGTGGSKAEWK